MSGCTLLDKILGKDDDDTAVTVVVGDNYLINGIVNVPAAGASKATTEKVQYKIQAGVVAYLLSDFATEADLLDFKNKFLQKITTNSLGYYVFNGLAKGKYNLIFDANDDGKCDLFIKSVESSETVSETVQYFVREYNTLVNAIYSITADKSEYDHGNSAIFTVTGYNKDEDKEVQIEIWNENDSEKYLLKTAKQTVPKATTTTLTFIVTIPSEWAGSDATSKPSYRAYVAVGENQLSSVGFSISGSAEGDTSAPTTGNSGTIAAVFNQDTTSVTLTWTKGTDTVTDSTKLEYIVYYSLSNNIDTAENAKKNGTIGMSWTADTGTISIIGLVSETQYYFNVLSKDLSGNVTAYTMISAKGDATGPASGNSGTITTDNVGAETLTLNWTKATDAVSVQGTLQYLVYFSTSNNLDTVANCEAIGTTFEAYTANISSKNITGLTSSTTYYFNVIVKDEAGNKSLYTTVTQATTAPDTVDPIPGNSGTITTASVAAASLTLNWTAGTDNITDQANLKYLVYKSTSNNIDTIANCEANDTAVGTYTANITTTDLNGLLPSTTYYFNLIVKDEAGNKSVYTTVTQATTADTTNPTPGNSGIITSASVSSTSLTLNWTAATDDVSTQANLEYLVYYSASNNITSVVKCVENGTTDGVYASNITTKNITGLSSSDPYYFNVVVRDEAGHSAIFSTLTQSTIDNINPTPGNSGTITSASVASTSLTLNWTAATDDYSTPANLQYLAYYSTNNDITSVANCEDNGTAIGSYASNITTKGVTDLTSSTIYYFNVVVRDEAGNQAAFSPLTQATTDITNPIPGNSGTITSASVSSTSLTLNWTAATDNFSSQANLEYLVYYSELGNITNVGDWEANGNFFGSYASNITTKSVTGLSSSKTYYFNVVVKDEAENKAVYSTLLQATNP